MVGTSHFYTAFSDPGAGSVWLFLIVALIIVGVLEANALGFIGGTAASPVKQPYESVASVIISGFVLWAILWILTEIIFG
jgi:hypothetical protein